MYTFEAYYLKMDTDEALSRFIEFDGQSFNTEEECYVYAMKEAYRLKQPNELLSGVDIIMC